MSVRKWQFERVCFCLDWGVIFMGFVLCLCRWGEPRPHICDLQALGSCSSQAAVGVCLLGADSAVGLMPACSLFMPRICASKPSIRQNYSPSPEGSVRLGWPEGDSIVWIKHNIFYSSREYVYIKWRRSIDLFHPGFFSLGTIGVLAIIDILSNNNSLWLGLSWALQNVQQRSCSAHEMPAAPSPRCDNQKRLRALPNGPWGPQITPSWEPLV